MKIAIVGAGKLGLRVAEALLGGDHSITLIDNDEKVLNNLSSQLDVMAVISSGKQVSVLKDVHISQYDFLIATTSSDEENILIAAFAKKLGCSRVIARVRDPEHTHQFDFIKSLTGIDHIVNPDLAIATEIYKYLAEKYTLSNGIYTSGKIALAEFPVDRMPRLIGLTPSDVRVTLNNSQIAAISRNGKVIIPTKDIVIQKEDALYVIGARDDILKLNSKVHEKGKWTDLQKVMVIGGGNTSLFLCQKLSDFGASVKVVERNKKRCHYLSEHLDNTMILHGDGSDMTLLEEENLDEMDAFVTTTGFDEDNLLLALVAKKHGIEDVIAKVREDLYEEIISSLGVDMALNPLDISASNILRLIQGSSKIISSQLIQGQAEIIEIIARDPMKILDTTIRKAKLPEGAFVASITRGTDVIIPTGDSKIDEGDRLTILCLLHDLDELETLLRTY